MQADESTFLDNNSIANGLLSFEVFYFVTIRGLLPSGTPPKVRSPFQKNVLPTLLHSIFQTYFTLARNLVVMDDSSVSANKVMMDLTILVLELELVSTFLHSNHPFEHYYHFVCTIFERVIAMQKSITNTNTNTNTCRTATQARIYQIEKAKSYWQQKIWSRVS